MSNSLIILVWLSLSVLFFAISGHGCSNKSSNKGDNIGISVTTENDPPSGKKIVVISAYEKASDLSTDRRASLKFRIEKDTRIVDVSNSPSSLEIRLSDSDKIYRFDIQKFIRGEYANSHQSQMGEYSNLDDFAKGAESE